MLKNRKRIWLAACLIVALLLVVSAVFKNNDTAEPDRSFTLQTLTDSAGNVYLPVSDLGAANEYKVKEKKEKDKETDEICYSLVLSDKNKKRPDLNVSYSLTEDGTVDSISCRRGDTDLLVDTPPLYYDGKLFLTTAIIGELFDVSIELTDTGDVIFCPKE